jgi:hypothetical protein
MNFQWQDDTFSNPSSRTVESPGVNSSQFSTYSLARTHLSTIAETLSQILEVIELTAGGQKLIFKELVQAAEAERKVPLRRNIVARRRDSRASI